MKKLFPLSLLVLSLCLLFSTCKKEPEIIVKTETITIRDTLTIVQNDTILVVNLDTIFNTVDDDSTILFILLRHAEVESGGSNPVLSFEGKDRAAELRRILKNVDLDAIYSTNFNRTIATVTPSAIEHGLPVEIYNGFDMPGFKDQVLANNKGQTLLVSGHSDTTPELLNLLTETADYATFPENSYDRLYFVSVNSLGTATVIPMEYGVDTP